ncbi:hypothetical protein N7447_002049 [Penicillium robsamsonii]|uniref:uncharacterized protein n=1 Tax=Penicillium robsamsonii TaxID=1792511 RepID=UPI002546D19B|nr:uncharacterized protein N7447_002049 [Penicillium robsamsonii]KAJ5836023.1 hypothetical protein N7447_002049 [Penicillium robsamsonii]
MSRATCDFERGMSIKNMKQIWQALGIFSRHEDRRAVGRIVELVVYAPLYGTYFYKRHSHYREYRLRKPDLLLALSTQLNELPAAVRAHVPDDDELCMRLYDLLRFMRYTHSEQGWKPEEWDFLESVTQ